MTDEAPVVPSTNRRRRQLIDVADALVPDRLPPHSVEAEKGVLGCILLDPVECLQPCREALKSGSSTFYDLKHQVIYDALVTMRIKGATIDIITLQQWLKDHRQLDSVGGIAYLMSLSDSVPSAANLRYYLEIVVGKFARREVIRSAQAVVSDAYNESTESADFITHAQRSLVSTFSGLANGSIEEVWSVNDLLEYDVAHDPNAIIGLHQGRTTRYLCRGYGSWLIGPSGVGKSSLIHQQAICFALGRDFFGIQPVRPLRVLVIQAENDKGDAAEQTQGILDSLGITSFSDEMAELEERLRVVTERRTVGPKFCGWLERQIALHNADVVFCDPFLSFAGIDVSRQDQCSQFLRTALNPVLADTGAVLIAAHHTGKPKDSKATQGWTVFDHAYAGIGSSELVNWARAISVLFPVGDTGRFELRLAKRGKRAFATNPNGELTTSLFLQHAERGISWTQCDPPAPKPEGEHKGGRPSKVDELLAVGLGPVIDKLTVPIGRNDLAKLIEAFAAQKCLDVSLDTCKRVIPRLVKTRALVKKDEGYFRA